MDQSSGKMNSSGFEDDDDTPGAALKAVKDKWSELGPLKLEEIIENSGSQID